MVEVRGVQENSNPQKPEEMVEQHQPTLSETPHQPIVVKMSWSKAVSRVLITLIIVCGILYIPYRMFGFYGLVINHTADVVGKLSTTFNSGSITSDFRNYVSTLSTGNDLQVTVLKTDESITRSEAKSYLWGYVGGEATVEIRFPVEYVYKINLNDLWEINFDEKTNEIFVQAPKIEFNTPSIDYSQLTKETKQGSIFISENRMQDEVKAMIMEELNQRAEEKIKIVLEAARNETVKFFQTFIEKQIVTTNGFKPHITVTFANEITTIPVMETGNTIELENTP